MSMTCIYVFVSVITHQVHSGGSVTQGHADLGGCVSDDFMIHPLQSDFIFFCVPEGPDANSLTDLTPLGDATLCSRLPKCLCDTDKQKSSQCI